METFHANPVVIPRSRSDRHSHSRQSSSSSSNRSEGDKERNEAAVIEEESLLRGVEENEGVPYRCHVLRFVLAFFVLLSFFALVLWGASRTQKPRITMKSITFESFFVHAGVDASNVPTSMATLNSTVEFTYRNTGSFFAVDVTSTPLSLNYFGITVASGNMSHFHQSKQSQRELNVVVMGKQVALYGGGPGVSGTGPVNMTLSFTVRSKAYVLGKVVKSKFHNHVRCSVVMDRTELGRAVSLKNSCQ
ncbi:Late embryogenesis abundant protein [Musa troglodytarum]|uniref:Late embryogenesis abundant protein n=1 Tax=Musa troglodytarum TaxID=320322 RepID=A0A9E7ELH9_9LILI|nr:Late embryogenesis abundant protein [Musa troglodytarum]